MNLLVVGVNHRTAPVDLLERLAVTPAEGPQTLGVLLTHPYVREAVVLSTCNRVEIYAAVSAFHGALTDVGSVLAARAELPPNELATHLYVHYETEAVRHAFRVAAGLDSMVVGEAQILGQLREAYGMASEHEAVGRLLHELMQQALRVGKRAHSETGIDRAGRSVVTAALDLAAGELKGTLAGRPTLVIGAGAMGSLSLATLQRTGAGPLFVANRGADRAVRLAGAYEASAVPFDGIETVMSTVDIVVCATAAAGVVLSAHTVAEAMAHRRKPLIILDLAVPRDVEPAAAELPGVTLIDIERLGAAAGNAAPAVDVAAAERLVAEEVDAFLTWLRGADVAPTVAALRSRADEVVAHELGRLASRRPDLTEEQRADIAHTLHRVVQRLLHSPTVRVRELAAGPDGDRAAAMLRELFDLEVPRPRWADEVPAIGGERP